MHSYIKSTIGLSSHIPPFSTNPTIQRLIIYLYNSNTPLNFSNPLDRRSLKNLERLKTRSLPISPCLSVSLSDFDSVLLKNPRRIISSINTIFCATVVTLALLSLWFFLFFPCFLFCFFLIRFPFFFMNISMEINHEGKRGRGFLISQFLLRILGIAITLAAISLMVTNKQTIDIFGFDMDAKYNYSPAFKYFVYANIAAVVMSVLSLLLFVVHANPRTSCRLFTIFVSDFIATVLGVSGCAAAFAIGYLGRYGNRHTFWNPICDYLERYCKRVTTSLILSVVGLIISVILTLWSAFKASVSM